MIPNVLGMIDWLDQTLLNTLNETIAKINDLSIP